MRLSFSALDEASLAEAAKRLATVIAQSPSVARR
jgi:DNA-binding transcriptional MocR family regulator